MDWNLNTHDLDWSWDNIANGGAKGFLAPSLNITRNEETFIHEEKEKEVINKADEDSKKMYSWNGFSGYNFDDGSPAKHLVATSGNSSVENIVSFMQRYPKRCRGSYDIMQNPCCQVEGCDIDLTLAKEYHKRHRICEDHSKTPMVIVAGMERRFCQQCSRFHDLSEFDDKKRSCRRRLSDHNARRRRPSNNGTSSGSSILNSNSIGKSTFCLKAIRDGGLNESGCDSNSGHAHSLLSMNSLGSNSPVASVTEAHLLVHSVTPYWPHCFNK